MDSLNQKPVSNLHPNCFGNVTKFDWTDAFYNMDVSRFIAMFHPQITQRAAAGDHVNFGAEGAAKTYTRASKLYTHCNFTWQADTKYRTYIEWELLTHNNMVMEGMTILTKDDEGKVIYAINGHNSLMELMLFREHMQKTGLDGSSAVHQTWKEGERQYGFEPKVIRIPDGFLCAKGITETAFPDAFNSASEEAIGALLADNVVLRSGYAVGEITGKEAVATTLAAVSRFFERHTFTHQASSGNHLYYQYEGALLNTFLLRDGFFVLVFDETGKIKKITDQPIPLTGALSISGYLKNTVADQVGAEYFYRDTLFQEAIDKYGIDRLFEI